MQLLDCRIVCVLVRHEESPSCRAAVGIEPLFVEQLIVQQDVVDVDSPVEGKRHHLGDARDIKLAVGHPRGLHTEHTMPCDHLIMLRHTWVPSAEQKHKGKRHADGSQMSALKI